MSVGPRVRKKVGPGIMLLPRAVCTSGAVVAATVGPANGNHDENGGGPHGGGKGHDGENE